MVSRRAFISGVGLGVAGLWGVQNVTSGDVPAIDTGSVTGEEREVLKSVEYDKLIQELTFYSTGEVDILLQEDHGCHTAMEFGHSKSDEKYKTWDAPEFAGPKTVDLQSVIQSNGPYPNRKFELELTGGEDICVGVGLSIVTVEVPESYLPD